jgi:2-amino-4-hydroxy-6-hydroxymethyldihydropteridine diphosphokinase
MRAIDGLREFGVVRRQSRLFRTKPWGYACQADFVNAVVLLTTPLAPLELLHRLQRLERRLGRRPGIRWGPRAIDLDILTYGDVVSSGELCLPHPRMLERAFVLVPLTELDPSFTAARDALDASELASVAALESPRA